MCQTYTLFFRGIRSVVAGLRGTAIFMSALLVAMLVWPAAHASSPLPEPLPRGADTLHIRLEAIDTLATFDAPTTVRRDARERLYVLEPNQHQLHVLGPTRTVQRTIGGHGTRAGQFRRPAELDPTNGQVLLIADTGNGRIQRLTTDGRALEVIALSHRNEPPAATYRPSRNDAASTGSGRPTAVQSAPGSGLVVLESDADALWYLNGDRTVLRRLAPFDVPLDRWQPHAIVRSPTGDLWVLEAERPRVLITDALGSIVAHPTISVHADGGFVSGFAVGRAVGLVQPRGITLVDADTYAPRRHWHWPDAANALQSVAASRDSLYLLAGPHLMATPRP